MQPAAIDAGEIHRGVFVHRVMDEVGNRGGTHSLTYLHLCHGNGLVPAGACPKA